MQFYKINFCQVIIFKLYTVYKKHEMAKIGNQTRKKITSIIASVRMILLLTACINIKISEVFYLEFEVKTTALLLTNIFSYTVNW